jgi:HEAT repeat protein
MAPRIWPLIVLALSLGQPVVVRAQLTAEESRLFSQLLTEPDGPPSFEKRLRLIGDAIEREGDPKWRPTSFILVDLKRARIPAAEGVPFLLKRLEHSSEAVRRTVLRMVGAYGLEAKPAVPAVLERMQRDPVPALRADAMRTLATIDPANADSAAALLDQLGADDAANRAALQALVAMAKVVPKSATPRIAKFQEHRSTDLGVLAHELIGKILALERPTLAQLRKMTAIEWREAPDQGYAVFASIVEAGKHADFAVPLVLATLDSAPPPYLEWVAIDTLAKLRTGNPQAIAAVVERLSAKDLAIRARAQTALQQIDLTQPESVRALAAGLRHKDRAVQLGVAAALRSWDDSGRLPPAAHSAMLAPLLETLSEWHDTASPAQLEACLPLLRRFGTKAAAAAETLVKLVQSENQLKQHGAYMPTLRGKVLAVLANVGVPESGQDLVLQALKQGPTNQPDGGHAYAAAARAAATFAKAEEVVPLLAPGLTVKPPERALYFINWSGDGPAKPTTVRLEAIRALAKFGPAAEAVLPILREIAEAKPDLSSVDFDSRVYQEARRAFEAIAGKPLPPAQGVFADGKKEQLHLDDRLQIKMTLKLQNPRPHDVFKRLQKSTGLTFTMDENVDPDTPVWASIHAMQTPAWSAMRQMAAAPSIQGTWQDLGDGYRLVGKKKAVDEKIAKAAKVPFPPFRDDSEPPQPLAAEEWPPRKEYAEDYHPALKESRSEIPGLIVYGPDAEACVKFEAEGMRITLPLDYPRPRPGTGLITDFGVKGDFEITFDFAVLAPPRDGKPNLPAELRLMIVPHEPVQPATWHKASQNRASLLRVVADQGPDQTGQFVANRAEWTGNIPTDKWGNENFSQVEQQTNRHFPARARTGRLRLVRHGTILYYFASDGEGKDFALLSKSEFGARDLRNVRILGSTSGPAASLDCRISDVHIRADAFVKSAAAIPTPASPEEIAHSSWLIALVTAVSLATIVVSLGIWLLVRRHRQSTPATQPTEGPPSSATIVFACGSCGKRLKAKIANAGKKLKCPGCGTMTVFPASPPADAEGIP